MGDYRPPGVIGRAARDQRLAAVKAVRQGSQKTENIGQPYGKMSGQSQLLPPVSFVERIDMTTHKITKLSELPALPCKGMIARTLEEVESWATKHNAQEFWYFTNRAGLITAMIEAK